MARITIMLFITSAIFITTSIIADIIVYKRLKINGKKIAKAHQWNSILCTLYMIGAAIAFSFNPEDLLGLRYIIYIFFLLSAPKLLFLLLWRISQLISFFFKKKASQKAFYLSMGFAFACFLLILHGGIIGRFNLTIEQVEIKSHRLPHSFDGLRIVQISDLHLGHFRDTPSFMQRVVDSINNLHPDLIVQTGDIVTNSTEEIKPFLSILSQLKAKYGIYAILGNHDYGDYIHWESELAKKENEELLIKLQEKMGWKMLNNKHTTIHNSQGDSIYIVGVENWGNPPFPRYGDLKKALKNADINHTFTLLLTHDPQHWDAEIVGKKAIDITFSGHTHASQFQIGSFSPSQFKYKEWSGLYQTKEQYIYVNRGIGTVMFPMRIGNATPEITLLTVKYKKD
jgi:predicted MPP superfamily phosphohydrolase